MCLPHADCWLWRGFFLLSLVKHIWYRTSRIKRFRPAPTFVEAEILPRRKHKWEVKKSDGISHRVLLVEHRLEEGKDFLDVTLTNNTYHRRPVSIIDLKSGATPRTKAAR